MASQRSFDDGPEVALHDFPEPMPPQPQLPPTAAAASYFGGSVITNDKVDPNYIPIPPVAQYQPFAYGPHDGSHAGDGTVPRSQRPGPFGCTYLVFWLSAIIALLCMTVIGLAAGTGVEASRANNAEKSLARLSLAATATPSTATSVSVSASASISASAAATSTSYASIDLGCSNQPDTVTGTRVTSFQLLGQQTFTIHCNKDAQNTPLLSLFVADFEACIDACSGYTKYATDTFNESTPDTTCGAVSFIPLWTKKANAFKGGAPGNCYLKPVPQNSTKLPAPNIGTECHAALLDST